MKFNFKTRSGDPIFPMGFGSGFSAGDYKNPKKIDKILKKAIDLRINFIDTGENYGEGKGELLIGNTIKTNRSKIFISTKFSPENSSYEKVIKSCEGSLRRLKTDYIDLYQFHWPNPKVPLEETASALNYLIKTGKIRFTGAGNFSLKQLKKLKKLINKYKLISTQDEFNLHERTISLNGVLKYCQNENLTLISYSPLDQGRMFLNGLQTKLLADLSERYKKNTHQIILNWILTNKSVLPIPMTTNISHLEENLKFLDFNLSEKDIKKIDSLFRQKIHQIPPGEIKVSVSGERGRMVYQTIKQAMNNKLGFIPGPKDLADYLKTDNQIKPVRLVYSRDKKYKYELINGRIRFWAWVIAFGNKKPIPSYLR